MATLDNQMLTAFEKQDSVSDLQRETIGSFNYNKNKYVNQIANQVINLGFDRNYAFNIADRAKKDSFWRDLIAKEDDNINLIEGNFDALATSNYNPADNTIPFEEDAQKIAFESVIKDQGDDAFLNQENQIGQRWAEYSKTLYNASVKNKILKGDYLDPKTFEGDPFDTSAIDPKTDREFAQWGIEHIGQLNYNLLELGMAAGDVAIDDPDVAFSLYSMLDIYDKLPNFTKKGWGRFAKGVATDPFTYMGLGALYQTAKGVFGKKLTTDAIKQSLLGNIKKRFPMYAVGSAEGAAYMGLDEFHRQTIGIKAEELSQRDITNQLLSIGVGSVFGLGGTVAGDLAITGIKKGIDQLKNIKIGMGTEFEVLDPIKPKQIAGKSDPIEGDIIDLTPSNRLASSGEPIVSKETPLLESPESKLLLKDENRPTGLARERIQKDLDYGFYMPGLLKLYEIQDAANALDGGRYFIERGYNKASHKGEFFLKHFKEKLGYKDEELFFTGMEKYLKDNKDLTFTQVVDYAKNNPIKISEKVNLDKQAIEDLKVKLADENQEINFKFEPNLELSYPDALNANKLFSTDSLTDSLKENSFKVLSFNEGIHKPNANYFLQLYEHLWLPFKNAYRNNAQLGIFRRPNSLKKEMSKWSTSGVLGGRGINSERRLDPVAMRIMQQIGLDQDLDNLFASFHLALQQRKPDPTKNTRTQINEIVTDISRKYYEKSDMKDVILLPEAQNVEVNNVYLFSRFSPLFNAQVKMLRAALIQGRLGGYNAPRAGKDKDYLFYDYIDRGNLQSGYNPNASILSDKKMLFANKNKPYFTSLDESRATDDLLRQTGHRPATKDELIAYKNYLLNKRKNMVNLEADPSIPDPEDVGYTRFINSLYSPEGQLKELPTLLDSQDFYGLGMRMEEEPSQMGFRTELNDLDLDKITKISDIELDSIEFREFGEFAHSSLSKKYFQGYENVIGTPELEKTMEKYHQLFPGYPGSYTSPSKSGLVNRTMFQLQGIHEDNLFSQLKQRYLRYTNPIKGNYSVHRTSQFRAKDGETDSGDPIFRNLADQKYYSSSPGEKEWGEEQIQNFLLGTKVSEYQDPFYYNIEKGELESFQEALIQAKNVYDNALILSGKSFANVDVPEPLQYINRYGLESEYHVRYGQNAKEITLTIDPTIYMKRTVEKMGTQHAQFTHKLQKIVANFNKLEKEYNEMRDSYNLGEDYDYDSVSRYGVSNDNEIKKSIKGVANSPLSYPYTAAPDELKELSLEVQKKFIEKEAAVRNAIEIENVTQDMERIPGYGGHNRPYPKDHEMLFSSLLAQGYYNGRLITNVMEGQGDLVQALAPTKDQYGRQQGGYKEKSFNIDNVMKIIFEGNRDKNGARIQWRPGMPFVNDNKSALRLMLKRMLQHAMNDGSDYFGIPSGERVFNRWQTSGERNIGKITYYNQEWARQLVNIVKELDPDAKVIQVPDVADTSDFSKQLTNTDSLSADQFAAVKRKLDNQRGMIQKGSIDKTKRKYAENLIEEVFNNYVETTLSDLYNAVLDDDAIDELSLMSVIGNKLYDKMYTKGISNVSKYERNLAIARLDAFFRFGAFDHPSNKPFTVDDVSDQVAKQLSAFRQKYLKIRKEGSFRYEQYAGTNSSMLQPTIVQFFNDPNMDRLEASGIVIDKLDTTSNEGYENLYQFFDTLKLGGGSLLNVPSNLSKTRFRDKVTKYLKNRTSSDTFNENSEFFNLGRIKQESVDEALIPINDITSYFDNVYEIVAKEQGLELNDAFKTDIMEWNSAKQGYEVSRKLDPNSNNINKKMLYRDVPLKTIVFLTEKMKQAMRGGQSLFTIPGMIGIGAMMQEQGTENGNTR